jgi:hypothetical protein
LISIRNDLNCSCPSSRESLLELPEGKVARILLHGEILGEHDTERTERQKAAMQILKAGALYFGLVYGAGFVLGTIRVL